MVTAMADYVDIRYVLYGIEEHKKVADGCSEITREISDLIHNQLIDVMKHAPVVDAMPLRHGRWEKKKDAINWSCSVCGNEPFHCHLEHMNFCPNCGTKMDAEEREKRIRKAYIDVGSCRGWIVEGGLDKDGDGE